MKLRKFLRFRPDILGTLFCVLTFLCAAIYLAAIDSRHRYESVMAGQALTVSAMIDSRLERTVAAVRALSLDPALDDLGALGQIGPGTQALINVTGGRVLIITSGEGHQVIYDSLAPEGIPQPTGKVYPYLHPLFAAVKDTLVANTYAISDLHLSPRLGQHAATILVPVERNGQMIGAVALMLFGDRLSDLVRPTDVPGHQFATLVDGANRVVGRTRGPRSEHLGWPLPAWMADAMAGKSQGVMSGIGMIGVDNMMAFQQLAVAPHWRLIAGEPNASVGGMFWRPFLWLAVGGLCASIAMAWWVLAWRQRFLRDTDILRTQKEKLTNLFRTMPAVQFLATVQPDGQFRMSYIGGDFSRVTGRNWGDVATVAQWNRLRAPDSVPLGVVMQTALNEGNAVHEFRFGQPDGSWRWLRGEVTRIAQNADGSGEVVGYIVNIDDTRKALHHASSAVHLSSVGKITASLAAELRRPLAAAHITTEILEHELASDDTERAEERIALIKDKIGYVIQVHDQLQRFARDRGYAMSLQATAIEDVVTRVLDAVAPALREDHIDAVVNMPPLGCPQVMTNPVDLEQVLTCLVLNARDAIVSQGPSVFRRICVNVVPNLATGTVSIKITDNGGGIPADVMANLFEPFVTTKKDAGSIGLDLAICKAMIVRMHGAIDARNDDRGAVFTIVLPATSPATGTRLAHEN